MKTREQIEAQLAEVEALAKLRLQKGFLAGSEYVLSEAHALRWVLDSLLCAACGEPAQGNASLHRDGFGEGPEVPLCDGCGMGELPSCDQLWERIAKRRRQEMAG